MRHLEKAMEKFRCPVLRKADIKNLTIGVFLDWYRNHLDILGIFQWPDTVIEIEAWQP